MRPPCWDPSNQHSTARTPSPLCSFSFFSFFFFPRFFLSFLSFSVFPFPFLVLLSFVLSFRLDVFRLFLVSPPSSSLVLSLPCFPWWRILLFWYFVSSLHPPSAPCEPQVCVFPLRAVFFLAFLLFTFFFFSLPSLFRFRFGHRFFILSSFLWVLCCMLSPRFRFLLRLV